MQTSMGSNRNEIIPLESVLSALPSAVFVVGSDYNIVFWNPLCARWTEIDADAAIDKNLFDVLPELGADHFRQRLDLVISLGLPAVLSPQLWPLRSFSHGDNRDREVDVTITPVRSGAREQNFALFTIRDISELSLQIKLYRSMKDKAQAEVQRRTEVEEQLRASNRQLEALVRTDSLTAIPNRLAMVEIIEREFLQFGRRGHGFALVMIDIDNFKRFNDEYGHELGDVVLRAIASALAEHIRASDTIARWGGEEFLICLPNTTGEGAVQLSQKLVNHIRSTRVDHKGKQYSVGITAGVAVVSVDDQTIEQVVDRADQALLHGKRLGKNRVVSSDVL